MLIMLCSYFLTKMVIFQDVIVDTALILWLVGDDMAHWNYFHLIYLEMLATLD